MISTAPRSIHSIELPRLNGRPASLAEYRGTIVLAVNVASKCGLTPQYAGLQKLQDTYSARGFSVLGFPCNQFAFQEPNGAAKIEEFCQINYGVSFPLYSKLKVKGRGRHPLYEILSEFSDDQGKAGNVQWNFEKFLVDREGLVIRRFRPRTVPEDPAIVAAIENALG